MKILIFAMLALAVKLNQLGNVCSSKAIFNGHSLIGDDYADVKLVYNEIASCISLRSDDDALCCYVKAKFKNRDADKTYTHKGCIELNAVQLQDVKGTTKEYESYFNPDKYKNVDVDIDCNSKFVKLTGLVLLAFLL